MREAELLELIRRTDWIHDLLVQCDFDVRRVANGPVEPVRLDSGEPLEMVAGDAGGGAFMLAGEGEHRPVVYVGSEGEGGRIADSLHDALGLVVGLSSIHDATTVPIDWAFLEQADAELREDRPELDAERARLSEALGLPPVRTLLERMHEALRDERYRPIGSDHGARFQSMLGG